MTTTVPTQPTQGALVYTASLIGDYGCNGPEVQTLLVSTEPRSRGQVETANDTLIRDLSDLERRYRDAQPQPALPSQFGPWKGTYKEHRLALAAAKQASARWRTGLVATKQAYEHDAWSSLGIETYTYVDHPPQMTDLEYADEPEPGPLSVIHYYNCRCGHGGTYYADWATDDDPMTPAVQVDSVPEMLIAWPDIDGTWPAALSDKNLASTLNDKVAAVTAEFEAKLQDEYTQRVWTASLTPEQIDEFDYETYTRYSRLRPMSVGQSGWRSETTSTPVLPDLVNNDEYRRAVNRVYSAAGLYRIRPGD
jgi:hypothetical protein